MLFTGLAALSALAATGACASSAAYAARVEKTHPATGQFVDVGGHDVHVVRQGETGPVVFMVHGASANAQEFTWTLAPRLSGKAQVLMADRPGHGYSERFAGAEALGAQARMMAGALDQLAPGQKAVLVGHSFGGAVALRVALDRPELVSGLVLLAPVTHDWGGGGEAWYNKFAAPPVIGPGFSQLVPLVGPAQVEAGVTSVFAPAAAPDGYFENSAIGLMLRPQNFRANARDVISLRAELAAQSPRYPEIKVPVIVFSGSGDTVLKPQLHVGKLKQQIPVELIALPDEGHMPHHGEGEAVAAAILRLSENPAVR
jgi:pimeloyl-ACP methyl ester carboxylesterase